MAGTGSGLKGPGLCAHWKTGRRELRLAKRGGGGLSLSLWLHLALSVRLSVRPLFSLSALRPASKSGGWDCQSFQSSEVKRVKVNGSRKHACAMTTLLFVCASTWRCVYEVTWSVRVRQTQQALVRVSGDVVVVLSIGVIISTALYSCKIRQHRRCPGLRLECSAPDLALDNIHYTCSP